MSYDINIWSTEPLAAAESALQEAGFAKQEEGQYRLDGATWQIVLYGPRGVLPEDVPEEAMQILPGIRFLTEMNLEPVSAPQAGYRKLRQSARMIAGNTGGVVEDPQVENFTLPGGTKRFVAPKRERDERFSILRLSWWFEANRLGSKAGIAAFLELLGRYLPEALPRRYGLHEPPPHQYEKEGHRHFLDFLAEHKYDVIVWYPTRPVMGVSFHPVEKSGFVPRGAKKKYRCNHLAVSLDSSVLEEENWQRHLRHFWEACSKQLQPFFGDVRILDGYVSGRGTYYTDTRTAHHPVRSGWWTGIPRRPGAAMVVGSPYLDLWPAVREADEEAGALAFISDDRWGPESDVRTIVGEVPEDIAQATVPGWAPWPSDTKEHGFWRRLGKWGFKKAPEPQAWHFAHSEELPKVFPFS